MNTWDGAPAALQGREPQEAAPVPMQIGGIRHAIGCRSLHVAGRHILLAGQQSRDIARSIRMVERRAIRIGACQQATDAADSHENQPCY